MGNDVTGITYGQLNGQLDVPETRIRWGQLPNQTMPLDWAETFLAIVYTEHPGVFRAILPRLYGLPAEVPKRARRQP